MDIDILKEKIYALYNKNNSYTLKEYNILIEQCSNLHEMNAVIFLYDNMRYSKITPNNETYSHINKLHSKTCPEKNIIYIRDDGKKKLKPRRRIHKIMKGYNYSKNYNNALQYVNIVKTYIELNPHIKEYSRIKLAKNISKNCDISFNNSRYIITNLKKTKFLVQNDKQNNKQKLIFEYFNKS
tara:strand:- start:553 stop:1101 length:549 start_codon:yes stop_codon:yes gene_type:complete